MKLLRISLVAMAIMSFVISGCGDTTTKDDKSDKTEEKDDHADHDHEHHHQHGPNDGSHFMFDGTKDFAAEVVTYGENDLVKVMFCDFEGKKTIKKKATKVTVARTSKKDNTPFELTAIDPDAEGMTDGFKLDDKDLKLAVKVGAVTVTATIDGKDYTGKAMPHNH